MIASFCVSPNVYVFLLSSHKWYCNNWKINKIPFKFFSWFFTQILDCLNVPLIFWPQILSVKTNWHLRFSNVIVAICILFELDLIESNLIYIYLLILRYTEKPKIIVLDFRENKNIIVPSSFKILFKIEFKSLKNIFEMSSLYQYVFIFAFSIEWKFPSNIVNFNLFLKFNSQILIKFFTSLGILQN